MQCSVYMPAYQVENELEECVRRIPSNAWNRIHTLHIIDDGSKDRTWEIIQLLQSEFSKIQAHKMPFNQGYAAVVKKGLAECSKDGVKYCVCLHGDGQYAPEALVDMLDFAEKENAAILQGSRHANGGALEGGMPFYKWLAGKFLCQLENIVFKIRLTDYHSGYLIIANDFIKEIDVSKYNGNFEIDLEIIATACANKKNVREYPIPTRYAGEESHLNPINYGLRVLAVLWRYLNGYYKSK